MKATFTYSLALSAALTFIASKTLAADCGKAGIGITAIPTLGGSVNAMNAGGQVTGDLRLSTGASHAFLFSGGNMQDLGTLGGFISSGIGINGAGQVVGVAATEPVYDPETGRNTEYNRAFLYTGSAMLDLGTLGGTESYAVGINDRGQIAGNSETVERRTQAFIYENASMRGLGHLGGGDSIAAGLNQAGTVVGRSSTGTNWLGFVWRDGPMTDVGTLGSDSSALAINDNDVVVGDFTTTDRPPQSHAFVYENGTMIDLGTLGGTRSSARAINNLGQVVGQAATATEEYRAFLWQNGKMTDLNTLLPSGSPWVLTSASAINDSGMVAGVGKYNGEVQGYLLTLGAVNQTPVAVATVEKAGSGAIVTLDGSRSTDPDGDAVTYEWIFQGSVIGTAPTLTRAFPAGVSTVILRVTDPCGAVGETSVQVEISDTDTEAPTISKLRADPSVLNPPNHKLVPVRVTATTRDNTDPNPVTRIYQVTSNQTLAKDDVQITGHMALLLAATRSPSGGARTYTIQVESLDASGNRSTASVTVVVPHGNGNAANVK